MGRKLSQQVSVEDALGMCVKERIKKASLTTKRCPLCMSLLLNEKRTVQERYKWADYWYCEKCERQFMSFTCSKQSLQEKNKLGR